MRRVFVAATAALWLLAPAWAQTSTWVIDTAHSGVHFSVRHMMVSTVRGEFTKVSGTVLLDESDITKSSVEAAIEAATIQTREAKRDTHLRSADFLDVEKFPTLTFKSKSIQKSDSGKFKIVGDLTLRGVTREVVLDAEPPSPQIKDSRGGVKMGTSASTKINRKDFGLTWNRVLEAGGVAVSDEVSITLDLELNKKAP